MRFRLIGLLVAGGAGACGAPAGPAWLDSLEQQFAAGRRVADQVSITRSRGTDRSIHEIPLPALEHSLDSALAALRPAIDRARAEGPMLADSAAAGLMVAWYDRTVRLLESSAAGRRAGPADCPARGATLEQLQAATFACYGAAAARIVVDRDTLDRLSVLARLGSTANRGARERLFRSLGPVWRSVNGGDEPGSPYRRMVSLRRAAWTGGTPMAARGEALGIPGAVLEQWLESALEAWRAALPDTLFEPWDYYYYVGAAGRRLDDVIPLDSLLPLNHRFFRSLGADPDSIGVRYDIAPRDGKYPIAFSDFGGRAAFDGSVWRGAEPWVFASYRLGGFGNLNELLHETGHAIHTAAIQTRPAFADWPDSDTFTEGVAELAALEMFEPAWQQAFLGRSAPLDESLRAKYAWTMLDLAWALFEFRVHRPDAASPNTVWTDITGRYLRIAPHPELSWWAMRGQLIESPGYMVNYALGAFIVADLRAELVRRFGPFSAGRRGWYGEVAPLLFRYGAGRPAARVLRDVLGREPAPGALLEDLARIRTP